VIDYNAVFVISLLINVCGSLTAAGVSQTVCRQSYRLDESGFESQQGQRGFHFFRTTTSSRGPCSLHFNGYHKSFSGL